MAKIVAKNVAELNKHLGVFVESALEQSVAPAVKHEITKSAEELVYSRPEKVYKRREFDEGLKDERGYTADVSNMELRVANDNEQNPYSDRKGNLAPNAYHENMSFAEIIEYGNDGGIQPNPARPFMRKTADSLRNSKLHVESLKEGLRKQGLDVK